EGAFFKSPAAFDLLLQGTPHVPVLPLGIPNGANYLLSRQTDDIGTYANITGFSPANGAMVYKWNRASQAYDAYTFASGAWSPSEPTTAVGEAMWIAPTGSGFPPPIPMPPSILQQPMSQSVTQGVTVTFTVAALATQPIYYQWRLTGNNI